MSLLQTALTVSSLSSQLLLETHYESSLQWKGVLPRRGGSMLPRSQLVHMEHMRCIRLPNSTEQRTYVACSTLSTSS